MEKIVFDTKLHTGNELIDTQHSELIDRVNKLVESCQEGIGKLAAVKTLDFLMDYTDFHFSAEEKLQEENAYPSLAEHKALHDGFKKSVKELQEMLEEEQEPSAAFVAAVNTNIKDWLVNHIMKADQAVADYVKSR